MAQPRFQVNVGTTKIRLDFLIDLKQDLENKNKEKESWKKPVLAALDKLIEVVKSDTIVDSFSGFSSESAAIREEIKQLGLNPSCSPAVIDAFNEFTKVNIPQGLTKDKLNETLIKQLANKTLTELATAKYKAMMTLAPQFDEIVIAKLKGLKLRLAGLQADYPVHLANKPKFAPLQKRYIEALALFNQAILVPPVTLALVSILKTISTTYEALIKSLNTVVGDAQELTFPGIKDALDRHAKYLGAYTKLEEIKAFRKQLQDAQAKQQAAKQSSPQAQAAGSAPVPMPTTTTPLPKLSQHQAAGAGVLWHGKENTQGSDAAAAVVQAKRVNVPGGF